MDERLIPSPIVLVLRTGGVTRWPGRYLIINFCQLDQQRSRLAPLQPRLKALYARAWGWPAQLA
ncbi:hypothetical protein, partial [Leifsonia sp. SIMBA_070]|uniref:hypothetical protein n=1 Tax=Leifsonia sp. SIMBA_070 TaxID=3085810 RepID=UPI0039789DE6